MTMFSTKKQKAEEAPPPPALVPRRRFWDGFKIDALEKEHQRAQEMLEAARKAAGLAHSQTVAAMGRGERPGTAAIDEAKRQVESAEQVEGLAREALEAAQKWRKDREKAGPTDDDLFNLEQEFGDGFDRLDAAITEVLAAIGVIEGIRASSVVTLGNDHPVIGGLPYASLDAARVKLQAWYGAQEHKLWRS